MKPVYLHNYTDQQKSAIEDQKKKIDELVQLYKSGEKTITINGIAGAGKTQTVTEVAKQIRLHLLNSYNQEPPMAGAALSHGAKNILADRFDSYTNLNLRFHTLASLLKLRRHITKTGEIKFVPSYKKLQNPSLMDRPPIYAMDLVIIDECSQVSEEALKMIEEERGDDTIIIFLGDHHQTPPPSEYRKPDTDSPTFSFPGVTLTIPFRYEGDIQDLAKAVETEIDKIGNKGFAFLKSFAVAKDKDYSFTRNPAEFFDKFVETYGANEDKLNSTIMVSYRNKVTKDLSHRLRRRVLTRYHDYNYEDFEEKKVPKFVVGERIVCKKGSRDIDGTDAGELTTHKTFIVKAVKNHQAFVTYDNLLDLKVKVADAFADGFTQAKVQQHIPIYLLDLVDSSGKEYFDIPVLKNEFDRNYQGIKTLLQLKAESELSARHWAKYYEFLEFFIEFDYAHAVNTYVVQGDSYDHIFINLRDIMSVGPLTVREKLQSLYTALTRARKTVTILV
jgi:hypothetical protein